MDHSNNLVDYVVVCGSPLDHEDDKNLPKHPLARYIVDVAVVFPGSSEKIPNGYERIRLSPSGREIDLNIGKFWRTKVWIAVKYGWNDSTTLSLPPEGTPEEELPISAIICYNGSKDAAMTNGWKIVKRSVGGKAANINVGSGSANEIYIATKKIQLDGNPTRTPVVTHLTVIDKYYDEQCPVGYLAATDLNLNLKSSGHELYFCTKTLSYVSPSQRICPALLERFPRTDPKKAKLQLPPSIEQFCMPLGVQTRNFESPHRVPLPEWHPFVVSLLLLLLLSLL